MKHLLLILLVNILSIDKSLSKKSATITNLVPIDLENFFNVETQIIQDLQQYVEKETQRLDFLESYYNRLKTEYDKAIVNIEYYLGNPINAFTFIKRLGPDLEHMENVLKQKTEFKRRPELKYPTLEDRQDSMLSLALLQKLYDLNVTQLSEGVLEAPYRESNELFVEKVSPMTTGNLYTIAQFLMDRDQTKEAVPWLLETYRKYSNEGCDSCPFTILSVVEDISTAYYKLRDLSKAVEWSEIRVAMTPDDKGLEHLQPFLRTLRNEQMAPQNPIPSPTIKPVGPDYQKTPVENAEDYFNNLCRANIKSPPGQRKSLLCYYTNGPHKYFLLARLKTEVAHRFPRVLLFHNVLSDKETEELQNLAWPKLKIAPNSEMAMFKLFSATLDDAIDAVVTRVSKKVSLISGLSVDNSEKLQVIQYTPGKLYPLHEDKPDTPRKSKRFQKTPQPKSIDKIGSFMFYLSDVQLGGATIFPALNLTIFPEKGAALFWMNYLPNGLRDKSVMHLGCATLRGTKWIAMKWPSNYMEKQCPIWITEDGPVTEKNYKKVVKEHEKLGKKVLYRNNVINLETMLLKNSQETKNL